MATIGAPQNFIPPRLLGGAAVVFWGFIVEQPILGLIAALLIEAARSLPVGFDFKQSTYLRAWQLGALLFICTLAGQWALGKKVSEIYSIIGWAPLYFLPVELAQRYGTKDFIPANTFSFFARRKMLSDIREGRPVDPLMVNTGYPFIILCVLTAAQAGSSGVIPFIGTLTFALAALFFVTRNQKRWNSTIFLIFIIGLGGWFMQIGIMKAREWVQRKAGVIQEPATNSSFARTQIGKLGKLKQSSKIYWRATYEKGARPKLLKEASYNDYSRNQWWHRPALGEDESVIKQDEDYQSAGGPGLDTMLIFNYRPGDGPLDISKSQTVKLRGKVNTETVLPMPDGGQSVSGIARTLEELYRMEADVTGPNLASNPLGTVKLENPDSNVVEYTAFYGDPGRLESPPFKVRPTDRKVKDLQVPSSERQALRQIIDEAGLEGLSPRLAVLKLRSFFAKNFSYSTHLSIGKPRNTRHSSALTRFLTKDRVGHCEYYGTATTLIMRELGIPARYTVGFAVDEKEKGKPGAYILRGTHAHAWSRIYTGKKTAEGWSEGEWIDADLTPSNWLAIDPAAAEKPNALEDWLQRTREDAILWRNDPNNQGLVRNTIIILAIAGISWIVFRLYTARQRREKVLKQERPAPLALATLEPLMTKMLPARSTSEPIAMWASHLLGRDPELDQVLPNAIRLHQKVRFDPDGLTASEQHELNGVLQALEQVLQEKKDVLHSDELITTGQS